MCFVMLAAGGVTAGIEFLYQVITVLRRQRAVTKLYLITFGFSLFVPILLVNFTGLPGAVIGYLIVMCILLVLLVSEYASIRMDLRRKLTGKSAPDAEMPKASRSFRGKAAEAGAGSAPVATAAAAGVAAGSAAAGTPVAGGVAAVGAHAATAAGSASAAGGAPASAQTPQQRQHGGQAATQAANRLQPGAYADSPIAWSAGESVTMLAEPESPRAPRPSEVRAEREHREAVKARWTEAGKRREATRAGAHASGAASASSSAGDSADATASEAPKAGRHATTPEVAPSFGKRGKHEKDDN